MVILSGTASPWYSISLIMETTALKAFESRLSPSSVMIFQPFLAPSALLMLNETSAEDGVTAGAGSGLPCLELAAELFLEQLRSFAARKLAARRRSLLKLRAL